MTTPIEPTPPPGGGDTPAPIAPSSEDQKYAFLLKSPFAKMFKASGVTPTVKQIKLIIDGILKNVMTQMKQQEAETKKAQEHLRDVIEGKDT